MSYSIPSLVGTFSQDELGRRASQICRMFLQGHINTNELQSGGSALITFTANSATTVVTFLPGALSNTSQLILIPTTANAAAANNTWYISASSPSANTITLTHANNAQTNRTFGYVLIG